MNNTSLFRLTATAGTYVCQDLWAQNSQYSVFYPELYTDKPSAMPVYKVHITKTRKPDYSFMHRKLNILLSRRAMYYIISPLYLHMVSLLPGRSGSPFQVAGSAVRPLTKIPHCCTIRIGVFSDPMWSIDLSASTTGFVLDKHYLNYNFPEK